MFFLHFWILTIFAFGCVFFCFAIFEVRVWICWFPLPRTLGQKQFLVKGNPLRFRCQNAQQWDRSPAHGPTIVAALLPQFVMSPPSRLHTAAQKLMGGGLAYWSTPYCASQLLTQSMSNHRPGSKLAYILDYLPSGSANCSGPVSHPCTH